MSKKNPGTRQLDTGSDQDTLDNDEGKLLEQMKQDDGEGLDPPTPVAKPVAAAGPKVADGAAPALGADGKPVEAVEAKKEFVPLATFLETKNEGKALRERYEALEKNYQTLETRTDIILKGLMPKPEAPKPEVIPDFNEDPAGWIAATMKAQGKTLEQVQAELTERKAADAKNTDANKRQTEQQTFVKGVMDYALEKEKSFTAANADYMAASAFLVESRKGELEDAGWKPDQILQIINQERFAIAQKAKEEGADPAERVFKIAKRRGFAPKPAEGGDGKVAVSDAEKLSAIKAGQEQGQSLSGAPGAGPSPMTAKRLLEMSEAEFDTYKTAHPAEFQNLMGR